MNKKFLVGIASLALVTSVSAPAFAASTDHNRIGGQNRYETAAQIAQNVTKRDTAYIASGVSYSDALVAGALKDGPILLLDNNADAIRIVKDALKKLGVTKVYVLGGTGILPESLIKEVLDKDMSFERLAGSDRYATSVQVSKRVTSGASKVKRVYLANGTSLVDALVAGQLDDNAPILLVEKNYIPNEVKDEITRLAPDEIVVLGGSGAISDTIGSLATNASVRQALTSAEKTKLNTEKDTLSRYIRGWKTYTPDRAGGLGVYTDWTSSDSVRQALTDPTKIGAIKFDTDTTIGNVSPTASKANAGLKLEVGEIVPEFVGYTDLVQLSTKVLASDEAGVGKYLLNPVFGSDSYVKYVRDLDAAKQEWVAAGRPVKGATDTGKLTTLLNLLTKKFTTFDVNVDSYDTADKVEVALKATEGVTDAYKAAEKEHAAWVKLKSNANAGLTITLDRIDKINKSLRDNIGSPISASISRWGGTDRYETANIIARNSTRGYGTKIYLANGTTYADAVAGGALDGMLVLVDADGNVNSNTRALIKSKAADDAYTRNRQIVALGGTGAVNDTALQSVLDLMK